MVTRKEGAEEMTPTQKRAIHIEFTTDDLDALLLDPTGQCHWHGGTPPSRQFREQGVVAAGLQAGIPWATRRRSDGRCATDLHELAFNLGEERRRKTLELLLGDPNGVAEAEFED
jgi:hypothetical protein